MYAIVLKFSIVAGGCVPSAEVLVESIRRVALHDSHVEHAHAERQAMHVAAVIFVTAPDAISALQLSEVASYTVEQDTPALRLLSVRMLDRPPDDA